MINNSVEASPQTGFRGWVNAHPLPVVGALVALIALVLWLTHHSPPTPQAWYTTDDGATYFAHNYEVPPFTFHGKEAVQAWVYTCDGGQTRFLGYLMRFTPEGKEAMEHLLAERRAHQSSSPLTLPPGVQVKKPGGEAWVERRGGGGGGSQAAIERGNKISAAVRSGVSPQKAIVAADADPYEQITHVTCPTGKKATIFDP